MAVQTPKTKIVFCRICDTDYTRLAELCEAHGESISSFLRIALRQILSVDPKNSDPVLSNISALTLRVEEMSREIEELQAVISAKFDQLSREPVAG